MQQGDSSLVHMVDHLMSVSSGTNGFFLNDDTGLLNWLETAEDPVLFGVSYALLDFADTHTIQRDDLLIIETGGMKGRKKEITRMELHNQLQNGFPNAKIISEYGMTELCSQAYSKSDGRFYSAPWFKVLVRDDTDPFKLKESGRGALNIIDLANEHSCAFIATDDLGEVYEDGSFRVLGRLDDSDQRGCALLIA